VHKIQVKKFKLKKIKEFMHHWNELEIPFWAASLLAHRAARMSGRAPGI